MKTYSHPFFASSQISELETWRQPFITSCSKMQNSATQYCKRSNDSLIFPRSNSLLASYCTAVFLRAMQNANRGGLKEPWKETVTEKSIQITSCLISCGLKGINCRVRWDLLGFSLLCLLSCSCLSFPSFFIGSFWDFVVKLEWIGEKKDKKFLNFLSCFLYLVISLIISYIKTTFYFHNH